jgi:hypothetical protein
LTDQEYIDAINAESLRRGYTDVDSPLTEWTGPEPWLEAWYEDPKLTPAEQVEAEIQYAMETLWGS